MSKVIPKEFHAILMIVFVSPRFCLAFRHYVLWQFNFMIQQVHIIDTTVFLRGSYCPPLEIHPFSKRAAKSRLSIRIRFPQLHWFARREQLVTTPTSKPRHSSRFTVGTSAFRASCLRLPIPLLVPEKWSTTAKKSWRVLAWKNRCQHNSLPPTP